MNYAISEEKLTEVTRIVNRDTDPAATDELVRTEICADWNEGEEHQEWIDTATAEEIADWLASFYQEPQAPANKEFTVIHGPRYNPLTERVILNGVLESERLTPRLAARAARAGCGYRNSVTVWSNDDHGYRLYKATHRKIWKDA